MSYTVKAPCGVENEFDDEDKALDGKNTHEALCPDCGKDDVEIVESDHSESETETADEMVDTKDTERVTGDAYQNLPDETPEYSDADTSDATLEKLPKISPVEDTAQIVISQLNSDDMNRLVWDPNADVESVPYDVRNLPYDKPEPSAEAFDLFAGIIEGAIDVQYSVEEVTFTNEDETFGCTVIIEKQSESGTKRLPGIKTRQKSRTTGIDHWRERLYSKARRNALKQDIPPTMVSSLLTRYREIQ